ncbi:RluA family pseudouridine synthase [Clostridium luticellarii]|jgi:23S rRNA pseudouridine955/2504/2580 synthase|uniref:Pseudouridine synthase n=1 Tax=Clostridium luticellarii TaxID=1691940 RepID=A0A2T0BNX3_9CLOT|nr:RluA family pseudouridine synthase [Clostridium luticellarii]MCI1945081.1 RluA family pseudouridine synthase [Clostridium luticellarii]MCI1968574.1 RluA family pseudouridine synthase [Clostridium luticellarii]MCI1995878.1 RluA family pseudouridine synthase [Clostridium luticellarii]MCI2040948.1 RluA family pseudouridine synthase [Clostridium luticellarii]PRR85584.1 Ribosomal large subunit pseudouridine synthase C [Clostridium luticellarii]
MKVKIGSNEAGQRLDKFSRKWLKDVPLSAVYKAIRKGDIKVNGKKAREKYFLTEGDIIETNRYVTSSPESTKLKKVQSNFLKITYEDKNMLLVEKWPGVLVHSDKNSNDPTLTDYVLSYLYDKGEYNPQNEITFAPSPCNRLDRNTSGIVIYAKNYDSLKLLNEMIKNRSIKKYYEAVIKGRIEEGLYKGYILKDIKNNMSVVYDAPRKNAKEISMEVRIIQSCGTYSLVELELITGRSHQLRAHLAHLGNPIIGDTKYGIPKLNSFFYNKYGLKYQYLYAYKLNFRDCPDHLKYMENRTISEGLPPVFKKIKNDMFDKF